MHVGRNKQGEQAIMLIKIDSVVEADVVDKLQQIDGIGIEEIKYIEIKE